MRMKPLNHKERKTAIWKFIGSLIPFLITMPLFVYVFCFTSERHSIYIENRHSKKKSIYAEQAIHEERIDTIMTRGMEIVKGDKEDHQYKEILRLLNNTIEDGLGPMIYEKEKNPYQGIFEGARELLSVVDSVYMVKSDLIPATIQLEKLIKYNKEQRLSASK